MVYHRVEHKPTIIFFLKLAIRRWHVNAHSSNQWNQPQIFFVHVLLREKLVCAHYYYYLLLFLLYNCTWLVQWAVDLELYTYTLHLHIYNAKVLPHIYFPSVILYFIYFFWCKRKLAIDRCAAFEKKFCFSIWLIWLIFLIHY